jgi:hypothetical protein
MIIHCIFTEPDGTYRFRPDLVERLAAAKAWVNPTLYVMQAGIDRLREAREREGRLTPELVAQLEESRRALDVRVEAVRRMSAAGVRMTAGSDSPWGWYAPGEFVHEIHMMAQAGSRTDAIVTAPRGADSIAPAGVAGVSRRARLADVLVVRGDPTRDHRAVGRPRRLSGGSPHRPQSDVRSIEMVAASTRADDAGRGRSTRNSRRRKGRAGGRRWARQWLATSPGHDVPRRRVGSATGMAESNACVYGCLGSR